MTTKRGNRKTNLLMINGFTYSQDHNTCTWKCSSAYKGCRSKVRKLPDGTVYEVNIEHNHPAPEYYVKDGIYFKV
ncbi:hypothetical protein RR48_05187 [Papilio machaon]|uniref:FLYWCH-type domain-containing protein n=2 Tax=Papilio machaon TaxID=76193 RepID=A0A0N1PHV6_PAPMA|nr:hypothetical protein RR48_05187 [Papilio machaon]